MKLLETLIYTQPGAVEMHFRSSSSLSSSPFSDPYRYSHLSALPVFSSAVPSVSSSVPGTQIEPEISFEGSQAVRDTRFLILSQFLCAVLSHCLNVSQRISLTFSLPYLFSPTDAVVSCLILARFRLSFIDCSFFS